MAHETAETRWEPRRIDLGSLPNLREVGGAPTADGRRVRPGTLYRSTQLGSLDDGDRSVVDALGLAMVVDLRTAQEVEQTPDVQVTGTYVWLDVLRDFEMASAVGVNDIFANPSGFAEVLRDGTATALMHRAYAAMVDLPSARRSYGRWLCDLAVVPGPVLVHCTNGKDRTGWAVALALLAVGVDLDDVRTDYLTTNDQLLPSLTELLDAVGEQGIDPELLLPVIGVREEYLATALERVANLGGLPAYLDSMGVTDEVRTQLRDRLTA